MSQSSDTGGVGFLGIVTAVLITLKLTHVIDWSWWWVLAGIWIPGLLGVIVLLMLLGAKNLK